MMLKRYASEFIGTFVIVFAPVALSATGRMSGGDPRLLGAALVSGFAVLAMVYALGPISAAHFNPAVTFGFAAAKRFPWKFVLPYWLSQVIGAISAAALVAYLYGPGYGTHVPAEPWFFTKNVVTEGTLTFILMFVIIAVATDKRVSSAVPAIAIGFTVVFCVLVGGPVTGGSMNPARSLGPALFAGGDALREFYLYLLGPMIGAPLASLIFEKLRIEHTYAQGAPNELLEALEEVASEADVTFKA